MKELKIFTKGIVTNEDGRKFTRLIGGFGEDKPMFLIWQSAELLGLETRVVKMDFENNASNFEEGVDFIDLKSAINGVDSEINVDITKFLKENGYSQSKLNATKQWLAFSFSGMMKLVKIAKTKESWNIYDNFLEDYFKTKVENENMKSTLEEELNEINKEIYGLKGYIVFNPSEDERLQAQFKLDKLNEKREKIKIAIGTEEYIDIVKGIKGLQDNKQGYLTQSDFGRSFAREVGAKYVGRLFRVVGLAKRSKKETVPYEKFIPNYSMNKLDYEGKSVSYRWNYNKCVEFIDKWLNNNDYFEKFYSITDKDSLEYYIDSLYKKHVLDYEEEDEQMCM